MGYPANKAIVPAPRTAKQPIFAIPREVKMVPPPCISALLYSQPLKRRRYLHAYPLDRNYVNNHHPLYSNHSDHQGRNSYHLHLVLVVNDHFLLGLQTTKRLMYELRMMMKGHNGLLDLLEMRGFAVVLARLSPAVVYFSISNANTSAIWLREGTYAVFARE